MKEKNLRIIRKIINVTVWVIFIAAIGRLVFGQTKNVQRGVFTVLQILLMLFVLNLPRFFKGQFHIEIPFVIDISIVIFSFCGFILGDVFNFYSKIHGWDSVLHTLSGVILAIVAFEIIAFLDKTYTIPISVSPFFLALTTVLFSLSLGALWEIGEYIVDDVLHTNSQQYMETTAGAVVSEDDIPLVGHAALTDTMKDLMLDLGGAVVVASIGYSNLKRKQRKGLDTTE